MKKSLLLLIGLVTVATLMHTVLAGIEVDTPAGHCCPSLYVYLQSEFEFSSVLPLSNGTDTVESYELSFTPEPFYGFYVMKLVEEDSSTSHVDQVKLVIDQHIFPVFGEWPLLFSDNYYTTLEPGDSTIILFPAVPGENFSIQIEGHFN